VTTVGIATGAGRGMGLACARRLAAMVDALLLVDVDEAAVTAAAEKLVAARHGAAVEPFPLDVTDRDGLAGLAARVREIGTLRAVAHAAGISPSMAGWRRVLAVDLTGTALLAEALRPLATAGTAMVCFASMAPMLGGADPDPAVAAILDDPLDERFPDRLRDAVGPSIEDSGHAYAWAKRGVHRFVRREAIRLGPAGARVCSVSPGIIDTPQGRQLPDRHRRPGRRRRVRRRAEPRTVTMRHGICVPNLGEFADPRQVAELARRAEEAGWDGFFVWDHVVFPYGALEVADPWVLLTMVAMATGRIRFGPMVTPVARRRPGVLARQTTTLDRFSGGRLVFGAGLGFTLPAEFGTWGEPVQPRVVAQRLDEGLAVLAGLWSGERVDFHGEQVTAADVTFLRRGDHRPHPAGAAGRGPGDSASHRGGRPAPVR